MKEQFGARMDSALVGYVMRLAAIDGRTKSVAARFIVEAGAIKLRELGSFPALVAWLNGQIPIAADVTTKRKKK